MLHVLTLSLVVVLGSCGKTIPNLKNMKDKQSSFTNAPDDINFPEDMSGPGTPPGEIPGGGGGNTNTNTSNDTTSTSTSTSTSESSSESTSDSSSSNTTTSSSSSVADVITNAASPSLISADEYGISNCNQLQGIPSGTTATFKLLSDIDCSATATWNNGEGFVPLLNFRGKFNGNRKIIRNITIKPTAVISGWGDEGYGIFGFAQNAEIYDVGVLNAVVVGAARRVGILLGFGRGTKIVRSFSTGSVTNSLGDVDQYWTWSATGGLAGYIQPNGSGNPAVIMDSYSEATVLGATDYTGGLVGVVEAGDTTLIERSYASGNVGTRKGRTGALTTYSWGTIKDSFATGTSQSGLCQGVFGSITNSYYSGATSCGSNIGSDSSYFKGDVFNDNKAPFTNWDFDAIWVQVQNSYPRLKGFNYPDSPSFIAKDVGVAEEDFVTIGYINSGSFNGYWQVAGTCSNENELIEVKYKSQNGEGYTFVPCVDGNWIYNEMYGTDILRVEVKHGTAIAKMEMSNPTPYTGDPIDCATTDYVWRHEMTDIFGQSECHMVAYCSNGRPYVYIDTVSTQCPY